MYLRLRRSVILRNIMIRSNNTVSVIEPNLGAADNQNNSSTNDIPHPPEIENASSSNESISNIHVPSTADTVKVLESPETSASLNDKVNFKLKMREILSCKVCNELRRCPMFQVTYKFKVFCSK